MSIMNTEIITDIEGFRNLESIWDTLLSESGQHNIFLTFDWLLNWWQKNNKENSLFIVVVREGNKPVGIAPFALTRRFGFRQLRFLGSGISDYEDIIACGKTEEREKVTNEIIRALSWVKGWDILKLECLKQSSPNLSSFRGIKDSNLGVSFQMHKDGAPYLETSLGWDAFCSGLAKKFLADTKRQRARLFKENKDFLAEKVVNKEELKFLLDTLVAFHIKRRKSQKTKSILENKVARDFMKDIALRLFDKGRLDFRVIRYNGSIAAMHLGFKHLDTFYYYMPVFNEDFQQYSIGRLLLFDLIQHSFKDGIKKFDLMLGEEKYKSDWNPKIESLFSVSVYPKTIRGIAANQCFNRLNVRVKKILGKKW